MRAFLRPLRGCTSRYLQSRPSAAFQFLSSRKNSISATAHEYDSSGTDVLHPKFLPEPLIVKAQQYEQDFLDLERVLSEGGSFDPEKEKQFAKLSSISESLSTYKAMHDELKELEAMSSEDPSLKHEIMAELQQLVPRFNKSSNELLRKLLPAHPFQDKPCILELRPGIGGTEAMIFAQDLTNMYVNYAHKRHWKYHFISQQSNESGSGITSAILSIDEPGSYDRLRFEAGVHRVQRIPTTESKGRVHTSTAAVVVLPQMGDDSDKAIDAYTRTFKPDEIRIDIFRSRGKGGQHVNTTDSAVRLTHIPTGIVISMQDERSQHRNKAKAFAVLRARLAEKEQREKEDKERAARKEQVTSTDRPDKIRTYNYPQNRVTDHRCGFSLHDLEGMMAGERVDDVIDAMVDFETERDAKRLLDS